MLRVAYCSDLHLEFKQLNLKNTCNADVLVLAGDIVVAETMRRFPLYDNDRGTGSIYEYRSQEYQKFFETVSKEFKDVIVIAGNHEHYNGYFNKTINILKENLAKVGNNFHVLDKECVKIDDVTFIGATLWTDFDNRNEYTMYTVAQGMSDYSVITHDQSKGDGNDENYYRKLRATDTLSDHIKARMYIDHVAKESEKVVVVTHHGPTHKSIHEAYIGHALNGGYVSDLSNVMLDRESIKYWVHGHVHHDFDYEVWQCRVLCNPRGYPDEMPHEFALKVFEV